MIKGCQKNVVWIRSTESELFDEAYFIVSDKVRSKRISENDMVSEANRLISDRFSPAPIFGNAADGGKKRLSRLEKIKWFFLGIAASLGAFSLICFLI